MDYKIDVAVLGLKPDSFITGLIISGIIGVLRLKSGRWWARQMLQLIDYEYYKMCSGLTYT